MSFRYYDETEGADTGSRVAGAPSDAAQSMINALPAMKRALNIVSQYEILKADLCYMNVAAARGKGTDLNAEFRPTIHLIVNRSYHGEGSSRELFHVWIDPANAEYLSSKRY